jgi:putative CocE/NonD family hydrolase
VRLTETRLERNLLVELSDGATLAADLRLPAAEGRYPALVSYYPYRKDDVIGSAYEHATTFLAGRGFATLLVDFRGLGGSSGVAADAMDASEAEDLRELLAWTAGQPWCDGNIGMWGISYGGITALRAAAAGSPHLMAIAPVFASTDVYHDWLYPGGCRNALGALGIWGSFMLAMQLAPPMFADSDGRWERVWRERLDSARPYLLPWFEHTSRDGYWAPRAVAVEQITVPTLLVGGWRDLFPEAMVRAYERIEAPRRLLVGPWLHTAPDVSPFVKVDYLEELAEFFGHWLGGDAAPERPEVTFYVQGGGWRHEHSWPVPGKELRLFLGAGGTLGPEAASAESTVAYVGDPTVGVQAGLWDPLGTGLGLPLDQGPDDLRSLTFTTEPLPEASEITGSPEARLRLVLDGGDDVSVVVKLCEVAPDGRSSLVTTGWLRGSHRNSHDPPEAIPHGEALDYRVPLWATSYRLAAGSRLRVSVACADFPRIWPTPVNPRLRLVTGGEGASAVVLPVAVPSGHAGVDPTEPDPDVNRMPGLIGYEPRWTIERDLAADAVTVRTGVRLEVQTPGRDGSLLLDHLATARVARAHPDEASVRGETRVACRTPTGAFVEVETETRLTGAGAKLTGEVRSDGDVVFERQWES